MISCLDSTEWYWIDQGASKILASRWNMYVNLKPPQFSSHKKYHVILQSYLDYFHLGLFQQNLKRKRDFELIGLQLGSISPSLLNSAWWGKYTYYTLLIFSYSGSWGAPKRATEDIFYPCIIKLLTWLGNSSIFVWVSLEYRGSPYKRSLIRGFDKVSSLWSLHIHKNCAILFKGRCSIVRMARDAIKAWALIFLSAFFWCLCV